MEGAGLGFYGGSQVVIRRRFLLDRDEPIVWKSVVEELRRHGFGSSDICFTLNITRIKLWHWENDPEPNPGYEDGRALLKLLSKVRSLTNTSKNIQAA